MDAPGDDRIKAVYTAFSDRGEVDTDLFHADLEWHNAPEWPGGSIHRGVDAVRRELARQREAWGEARYEPVEIRRAGDKIVVLLDVVVKGKASGVPTGIEGAHVLTMRDGRVARIEAFVTREEALAAARMTAP